MGCSALQMIDFSELTPGARIGEKAFAQSGLQKVTFPAKLESIGKEAFLGCESLVFVRLPRELGRLEEAVFRNCPALRRCECGDVREWPANPAELVDGGTLTLLELTGDNFDLLPGKAMMAWLADDAAVLSEEFAGRKLGFFPITATDEL
jgi:hypothetical protein